MTVKSSFLMFAIHHLLHYGAVLQTTEWTMMENTAGTSNELVDELQSGQSMYDFGDALKVENSLF